MRIKERKVDDYEDYARPSAIVPDYDTSDRLTEVDRSHSKSLRYGVVIITAVMAGLGATSSSLANATIDQFGYSGIAASDVWWIFVAIAETIGFFRAINDLLTGGRY